MVYSAVVNAKKVSVIENSDGWAAGCKKPSDTSNMILAGFKNTSQVFQRRSRPIYMAKLVSSSVASTNTQLNLRLMRLRSSPCSRYTLTNPKVQAVKIKVMNI